MASRAEGGSVDTRSRLSPGADVKLRPESDSVEVVVARDAAGPEERAVLPVDEWLTTQCPKAAAEAVLPAVERRLGHSVNSLTAGAHFGSSAPTVVVSWTVGNGGEDVSGSSLSVDDLVAIVPGGVTATVAFAGHAHTCTVPVFVERTAAGRL